MDHKKWKQKSNNIPYLLNVEQQKAFTTFIARISHLLILWIWFIKIGSTWSADVAKMSTIILMVPTPVFLYDINSYILTNPRMT